MGVVRRLLLVELEQLTLDYRPGGGFAINARITMNARSANRSQLPGDKIFDDRVSLHFVAPPPTGWFQNVYHKKYLIP